VGLNPNCYNYILSTSPTDDTPTAAMTVEEDELEVRLRVAGSVEAMLRTQAQSSDTMQVKLQRIGRELPNESGTLCITVGVI
jgi:hypothetical protein